MTDRYQRNADRPAASSVANVEVAGGVDGHDPFGNVGGSGGGADLSAVDQDIVVLNGHRLAMEGPSDPDGAATLAAEDSDFYGLVVRNVPASGSTQFVVVETEGSTHYVRLVAGSAGANMSLFAGAAFATLSLNETNGLQLDGEDLLFASNTAPVLTAPNLSKHRLIVANDGTLSTEPVV